MTLVRWRPFRDTVSVQDEMNRLFDGFFGRTPAAFDTGWSPSVDISETKDEIVVKAEIPGLTKEEIEISLRDNVLTLKGEKKQEKEEKDTDYYRMERSYGAFSRSFNLPTVVRADKIRARYKDGVLNVVLPKAEEVKPKQIPVEVS